MPRIAPLQAEFHRKMQAQWEALLPQLECVVAPELDGVQGSSFASFGLADAGQDASTPKSSLADLRYAKRALHHS